MKQEKRFEAILPLTSVQETLLLHRQFAERDLGELHIECRLQGEVDASRLHQAWNEVIHANPALRTTIHWEKIKKPVQIVHPPFDVEVEYLDLTITSADSQLSLRSLKDNDIQKGLDLTSKPPYTFRLIKTGESDYRLLWYCHHITLDGWSTGVVLKDLVKAYDQPGSLKDVRPGMKQYIQWQRTKKALQPEELDHILTSDPVFQRGRGSSQMSFSESEVAIPEEVMKKLEPLIKEYGITSNTFFQGTWALCLHQFSQQDRVIFGSTVSGRSGDLTGVENLTGVLTNVVPVFSEWQDETLPEWLREFQTNLSKSLRLERHGLTDVMSLAADSGDRFNIDVLFTFENFPWEDLEGESFNLTEFKGGVTSNYPLSIIITPGVPWKVHCQYDQNALSSEQADGLLSKYLDIIRSSLIQEKVGDVTARPQQELLASPENGENRPDEMHGKTLPQNQTELALLKIWQDILGRNDLGVTDDFFKIGGRSIDALRIFSSIQAKWGENLAPATIIEHRDIRSIAAIISGESSDDAGEWKSLVPLNWMGEAPPLYCIHAGGAHVFAYRALADEFAGERPVYGIQPYGLDGYSGHNSSVEEMTRAYLEDILRSGQTGQIHILGYCFSAAVAAEMSILLKQREVDATIIIVDSAPGLTYGRPQLPLVGRIRKMLNIFRDGQWARVRDILEGKWDQFKSKYLGAFESEQMKAFRRTEAQLEVLYKQYEWKPHESTIHLIRSEEFANRSDKDIHVEEWQHLAGEHLKVHTVPGTHVGLFKEQYVKGLAETIKSILRDE